ncbi:MAG: FAD synthetase family protein [Eubacteriales bacterium]|nr:FAD synthetase family protein [Eubacteriales bacterium]
METILDGRAKTESAVLALGMFDGLHIGHRVLLRKAKALAKAANAPLVACTFVKHPLEMIAPEKAPTLLTTFEERVQLMDKLGVDILYAVPFDREMMNQLPECYVGELVRHFHPTDMVCGYNHNFGKGGSGTPALLTVLGGALDFRTFIVPHITFEGRDVSSSIIRELLSQGDVKAARQLLLRPYRRMGVAVEQENGMCSISMPPNGKQTVPVGHYRVLATVNGKTFPSVLTIRQQESGGCAVPVKVDRYAQVQIDFLSQC